jgi:60 kDa SS-A/Ro ribonucleoprotein
MEDVMANKSLFASLAGKLIPQTDARNSEGARAYAMQPRQRLAQLAVTGTLSRTFYASADAQLQDVLDAARDVDAAFIAKTAVYAREKGAMKDMPALLIALLSRLQAKEFAPAFQRVINNGRMLRNFVQIMRSGAVGRKSMGSRPKKLVEAWLATASDAQIMRAAVGQAPSLADVIKMVHPKPAGASREALYGYLIGKPYDVAALPEIASAFERFKRDPSAPVPDVPFQMLTALPLTGEHWAAIGRKAGWHMLRMNLNTFARHGVFEAEGFAQRAAERLADAQEIKRAKVFPYQLMMAYTMADQSVPRKVREALQDAMEIAVSNVPQIEGRVVVCPDVSGSMSSPVTGHRKGATSAVRCIDVAALVAAAFLRANPETRVIPFEQDVVRMDLNPRDTVMTNAEKLAKIGGGGTNCSAPLLKLVREKAKADLVVIVSDNESWADARQNGRGTGLMEAWRKFKAANRQAKLVCIDIQPSTTMQAVDRSDILNVGGFSDAVFEVIANFAKGQPGASHWVGEIERIEL